MTFRGAGAQACPEGWTFRDDGDFSGIHGLFGGRGGWVGVTFQDRVGFLGNGLSGEPWHGLGTTSGDLSNFLGKCETEIFLSDA